MDDNWIEHIRSYIGTILGVGGVLTVVITKLFDKRKTKAESNKIHAEANKIDAEAEKTLSDIVGDSATKVFGMLTQTSENMTNHMKLLEITNEKLKEEKLITREREIVNNYYIYVLEATLEQHNIPLPKKPEFPNSGVSL